MVNEDPRVLSHLGHSLSSPAAGSRWKRVFTALLKSETYITRPPHWCWLEGSASGGDTHSLLLLLFPKPWHEGLREGGHKTVGTRGMSCPACPHGWWDRRTPRAEPPWAEPRGTVPT